MSVSACPHHGDVLAEQRALREGAALVAPLHELLWVVGPGAVEFLQGIVSQDVAGMPPGSVRRSLLLGPQGKLRALLWLARGEDRVGVITDAGWGEAVAETLEYYRIRVKAEIRAEERPALEVWGAEAARVADADPERWVERDGEVVLPLHLPGVPRFLLVAADPQRLRERGASPAGTLAVTAVRVEEGEPLMGRDVDESTIPHETGLVEEAASFSKGCYLGYELVERIESRGRTTPRRLLGVAVTRNLLPPEGAEVWTAERQVGALTSVAESLRVGAPVGLALLHRSVSPGDEVSIRWPGGEAPGVVKALPMVRNPGF